MHKVFKTYKDYTDEFIQYSNLMLYKLNKDSKPKALYSSDIQNLLFGFFDIVYLKETVGKDILYTWFIRKPTSRLYDELTLSKLRGIIQLIALSINIKNYDYRNVSLAILDEIEASANNELIKDREFKFHPNNYILAYNGIFDNKTKKFHVIGSKEYIELTDKYTFLNNPTFNYGLSPINKTKRDLYDAFMNDLSGGNSQTRLLLEQSLYSIIEGNGRHKYFMISGDAGIGKSTLGRIMEALANKVNVQTLSVDKLSDDNAINNISPETRLVFGDDLKNGAKLSKDAITNYKTLVDGQAISVNVKFEHNRVIKTNATWVQMMNEPPKIYEIGKAITDRTIFIHLTGTNHRNETDEAAREMARRLDEYLDKENKGIINQDFIDAIASYLLDTIEPFKEFTIPKEVKQDTEDMVSENNWMYQFINYATEVGLFEFNELRQSTIVSCVEIFLKEHNSGMRMPSSRTIIREWKNLAESVGFSEVDMRSRKLNLMDFNPYCVSKCMFDGFKDSNKPSPVFINMNPTINQVKINRVKKALKNNSLNSELSNEELIILYYLTAQNNTLAASALNL